MPNVLAARKPALPLPPSPDSSSTTAGTERGDSLRPVAPGPTILVVAAILFGAMAVLAKGLTARLPGPEVAFVRFLVGLAACAVAAFTVRLRARNWIGLLLRGGFGGAAVLLYFTAIAHLPVGVATLLNYTAPVFTAIYAALFLGERPGWGAFGALSLTTLGLVCVVHAEAHAGALGFGPWHFAGVASAALSGAAIATIREVRRTDGSWEIFTAFCLFGAALTLFPSAAQWVAPSTVEWIGLGAVGAISVAAQLLMTYALRFVPATIAGILAQLTPISAMTLGWLLYGEKVTALAAVGAAITLAGASWGARLPRRMRKR
jgi:drug/metabolite transporter (DMT)-like permease